MPSEATSSKLLLLADPVTLSRVDHLGRLPDSMVRRVGIQELLSGLEGDCPIVSCDPAELLPEDGGRDVLGHRGRAEAFNALLGGTICRLLVVGDPEESRAGEDAGWNLSREVAWYEQGPLYRRRSGALPGDRG